MKPLIFIFAVLLSVTNAVVAQDEPGQSKRVHLITLPTEVSNTVGGNYIDTYVVYLKKGQRFHVQVENKTEYSKVYFDTVLAGTETRFGIDSSETTWSGVVPRTGDYEIRVIAHPAAKYRLLAYKTNGSRRAAHITDVNKLKGLAEGRRMNRQNPQSLQPATTPSPKR